MLTCITVIILLILFLMWYTKSSFDRHFNKFIELNNNITVITDQTTIIDINKKGLRFFEADSLKELQKRTKFLSKLFKEVVSDDTRYTNRIDWVTHIKHNQTIRVQIDKKNMTYTFDMQVSPIRKNRYMVTFHNISRVVAEKEAISKVAEIDALTKIYNRSRFNIELANAIRKAQVHRIPFSIILFDIDHFKKVNDKYGHDVGDNVLIQLTSLVKNILRDHDIFARWGGEEFIILLQSDAYELAERLRREIERFPFHTVKKLTCSFGISHYRKNDTDSSIIKRADKALYRAKQNGRNTICIEDEDKEDT